MIRSHIRQYGSYEKVAWETIPIPFDFQMTSLDIRDDLLDYESMRPYDPSYLKTHDMITDHRLVTPSEISEQECWVTLFGRCEAGYSVCVRIHFEPYFYIPVPMEWGESEKLRFKRILGECEPVRITHGHKKRLYGWIPDKKDPHQVEKIQVWKLYFKNLAYMRQTERKLLGWCKKIEQSPFYREFGSTGNSFYKPQPWENKVDVKFKFFDKYNLIPSGWVRIHEYQNPTGWVSHCQLEMVVQPGKFTYLDRSDMAPFLIMSVDGEMWSRNGEFPNALFPRDVIINIGATLWRSDKKHYEQFVFCLDNGNNPGFIKIDNITLFIYQTEKELLEGYRNFLTVDVDPDFITGYNINNFDFPYFSQRACEYWRDPEKSPEMEEMDEIFAKKYYRNTCDDDFEDETDLEPIIQSNSELTVESFMQMNQPKLKKEEEQKSSTNFHLPLDRSVKNLFFFTGRLWFEQVYLRSRVFVSAAMGERKDYFFDMSGRVTFDMYIEILRNHKLRSYKLDDVSYEFLKNNKIDLSYKTMMNNWTLGPAERTQNAIYCSKDCDLPIELMRCNKLCILPNLIEMSRVTFTPLDQIIQRGQQIKVFNQLIWYSHRQYFIVNDRPNIHIPDGYEGASVLEPLPGWYNCPIATLDFASLYPSIIRNKNLCYCTLVCNKHYLRVIDKYNIPHHKIQVEDRTHIFVTHFDGILPHIETHLLDERKKVRKSMKPLQNQMTQYNMEQLIADFKNKLIQGQVIDQVKYQDICEKYHELEKGPLINQEQYEEIYGKYSMLNAKQLAIKISCNSIYGFTGCGKKGIYPCPPISETITAVGRQMIEKTKELACQTVPGSVVIYGDTDSIMVKFPVSSDKSGLRESFELGYKVAQVVTKYMGTAVELEMEKVYYPYLLFGKKRYVGHMYEAYDEPPSKIDFKGIENVRRDWSKLTNEVMKNFQSILFEQKDPEKAIKYAQQFCYDMINNKQPVEKYVMSKSLKSHYKTDTLPHLAVVKKIQQRDPGTEPKVGDRVPYVVINRMTAKDKLCEFVEDPKYVEENKIPLNYEYYIEKQIQKPLLKFFEHFSKEPEQILAEPFFLAQRRRKGFSDNGIADLLNEKTQHIKVDDFLDEEPIQVTHPKYKNLFRRPVVKKVNLKPPKRKDNSTFGKKSKLLKLLPSDPKPIFDLPCESII